MKKKKKIVVGLLALCLMGISLTGCGQESKDEEEGILLSEQKVRIEVGEEVEVEIENFDDLKRVDVEVEDDDIAEIDFDDEDGIITIEGISPGKTTVTVSAKNEDDVSFKVTVEESEDARSDADEPDDSSSDADDSPSAEMPAPSADQEAEEVAGDYVSSYILDSDFWIDVTGGDTETADFLGKGNLTLDFIMSLESDGTAQLNMDTEKFASDFVNFIDDNYTEFMCMMVERDWDDLTQEEKEELESLKDVIISSLEEELIGSMDKSSDLLTGTWEYADGSLYFTFDGSEKSVTLNSGSFVIDVPNGDTFGFGDDSLVFTKVN